MDEIHSTFDEDMFASDTLFEQQGVTFYPSNHNTSPITIFPQQKVLDYFSGRDEIHKRVRIVRLGIELVETYTSRLETPDDLELTVDATPVYYHLLSESRKDHLSSAYDHKISQIFKMCYRAGIECVEAEINGLANHHPALKSTIVNHVKSLLKDKAITTSIQNCFVLREKLESLKSKLQYHMMHQVDSPVQESFGELTMMSNGSIIIAYSKDRPYHLMLMNYDQYVMLTDVIISRSCSLMACLINDQTSQRFLPTVDELKAVYKWGDDLINNYGYHAYAAIGEFESLLTCRMIRFEGSDPLDLGADYELSIHENAAEAEAEYGVRKSWVNDLFVVLKDINSMSKFSEIFGIRKHWGNPILDADLSGKAVQEKAAEIYPIDPYTKKMVLASFQRMITLSYIQAEGKWPLSEIDESIKFTPLGKCHSKKSIKINEKAEGHCFEHWASVRFKQNVVIDKCLNPLDLLSDKACSLYKPHLDSIYVTGYRKDSNLKTRPMESRRLLLEYMRKDHLTIDEIFRMVQSGSVPDDWLVNLCALKGTEMKHLKGRIFAVLPYELRQYFAGTEELIKKYIFPYNPHQTMTMKEDYLTKLLSDITGQLNPDSKSRELSVIHIIDFSKWNLRMSDENTEDIFKSMDDFLGTPNLLYATHFLFKKMLNVVQDPFNPPEGGVLNTRSNTVWTGHGRGWEGQRQKGWTALTSALLAYLEYLTGVSSKILGQGDNQILVSKFRIPDQYENASDWILQDPEGVKSTLDNFYEVLVETCLKMGLPIKKSESCRSLVFCNYGKRLYQCGIELTMELKRISRIATEANDSFPTTDSFLKTMTSAASAAPIYGAPSLTSLLVGHINVALTIHRAMSRNPLAHDLVQRKLSLIDQDLNASFLKRVLWIPACLGGPHRTTLFNSLFRGHPDPLAADMSTVTLAARAGSVYHKKILAYLKRVIIPADPDGRQDLAGLIRSPYSLNLSTYGRPLVPLQAAAGEAIKRYCKNKEMIPLFSIQTEQLEQDLTACLLSMKPFHPVIAHEIFARSLPGRKDAFLSGFKNTTSFSQLLQGSSMALRSKIEMREADQLVWWTKLARAIHSEGYDPSHDTPQHHVLLQALRETTWGIEMTGVTVPHPTEAMALTLSDYGVCSTECKKFLPDRVDIILLDDERVRLFGDNSRSRLTERLLHHHSYTGNRIKESMICRTLRASNHSTALEDAIRLNILRRWVTVPFSKLDTLLCDVISQRTDLSLTELNGLSGIPVRLSYTHRVAAIATKKRCSSACNTNLHSQIYISSNNMLNLSRSDVNYSFVYGQSFLMGQHLIGFNEFYDTTGESYEKRLCYHEHVYITDVSEVYDGVLDCQTEISLPKVNRVLCPLLFANKDSLELDVRGNRVIPLEWETPTTAQLKVARLAFGAQMIGDVLIKEERFHSFINVSSRMISNRRDAPLTVGDVMGIGIHDYFTSIALSICYYLPFEVIFNLEAYSNSAKSLETIVYTISYGTWSYLFAPLIMPEPLRKLRKLLYPDVSADFGTSVNSIIKPCLHFILTLIIKILEGQKNRLLYIEDLGKSAPTEFIILSDGPESTRYLLSKYLEINCALLSATHATRPRMESILLTRKIVSKLYNQDLVDAKGGIEAAAMVDFADFQLQWFNSPSYRVFTLPRPIFADLNQNWGSLVKECRPDENQEEVSRSISTILPKQLHVPEDLSLSCSAQPTTVTKLRCSCHNFIPGVSYPIERLYMPTGITSKNHYNVLNVLADLDLDSLGVASIGYKSASELVMFAATKRNQIIYYNPLLPLSSFSDHSAASFIPPELSSPDIKSKLAFCSEAILSQPCKDPILNIDCIQHHLSHHNLWTGILFKCNPMENHDSNKQYVSMSVQRISYLAHTCTNPNGWLMIEMPSICNHLSECVISQIGLYFSTVKLRRSIYQSHPNGSLHYIGFNKKNPANDPISLTTGGLLSSLSSADSTKITNFIRHHSNSTLPIIARDIGSRPKLKILDSLYPNGFSTAMMEYLGCSSIDHHDLTIDQIIIALEQAQSEVMSVASMITTYSDRLFYGKPLCTGMVLALSSHDCNGQLNEVGYLHLRISILLAILRLIPSLKLRDILFYMTNPFLSRRTLRLKTEFGVTIVKLRLALSHYLQFYAGHCFEIVGHVMNKRLPRDLYKVKTDDLHFRGVAPPATKRGPIMEMWVEGATREYKIEDFMWPRKSKILLLLFARYHLQANTTLLICEANSWINTISNICAANHSVDLNSIYNYPSDSQTYVILIDEATITQFFNLDLWKEYNMIALIKRSSLNNLLNLGLKKVWRPVFMGIVPEYAWAEFSPEGGYTLSGHSRDRWDRWSSIQSKWTTSAKTVCTCGDCAASSFIISQSCGVSESLVDYLSSNEDYVESNFDIHH